jgi:hypothetical protein
LLFDLCRSGAHINLVEHPARISCDTKLAATVWAPSYKRATVMQAPLAIVSFLGGVTAWLLGAGTAWFIAALLIGSVVPFAFIGIKPTHNQLLASGRDLGSGDTRVLLEKWGNLHAVRTGLSLLASVIYVINLLRT